MKKIVLGILIGFCLAFTTSAFADNIKQYILTKINYPIIVNGTEYSNSALPALNYEGTTYLPLKGIGDVLGEPVKWNPDLKRVEVGESVVAATPTPMPTATPLPTPAPPQRLTGYESVLKLNGDIYNVQYPIILSVDENKNYYINNKSMGSISIDALICYGTHDYSIQATTNPFVKGYINIDNSKVYVTSEYKYLNVSQGYDEMTFYNKDRTKSYFVSYKPDDMKGVYKGDPDLISLADLLSTLDISYKIEVDETNKLIIWSFD